VVVQVAMHLQLGQIKTNMLSVINLKLLFTKMFTDISIQIINCSTTNNIEAMIW